MYRQYEPVSRRPRIWSNIELRKIAPYFSGAILNVSGWADEDKQGNTYRSYFINAQSYEVSNYDGGRQKGKELTLENSIQLDLEASIPPDLRKRYDCVFSHTVLEHVYEVQQAVDNLCALSRDAIITVVPFMQKVHIRPGQYFDYWRFTPYALERLFEERGFKTVYRSGTPWRNCSLYYLYVVSCQPEKWWEILGYPKDIADLPQGEKAFRKSFLNYLAALKYKILRLVKLLKN